MEHITETAGHRMCSSACLWVHTCDLTGASSVASRESCFFFPKFSAGASDKVEDFFRVNSSRAPSDDPTLIEADCCIREFQLTCEKTRRQKVRRRGSPDGGKI